MADKPSPIQDAALLRLTCNADIASNKSAAGFCGKYCALQQIAESVRSRTRRVDAETVDIIENAFLDRKFARQRQAYFYYWAAADVLRSIVHFTKDGGPPQRALQILQTALSSDEPALRSAAIDVISQLPSPVNGPHPSVFQLTETPRIDWHGLIRNLGFDLSRPLRTYGRSMVAPIRRPRCGHLLVLKLARKDEIAETLAKEAAWMEFLGRRRSRIDPTFKVPELIRIDGAPVFRITNLPRRPKAIHPENLAVGFVADEDYFAYPNHPRMHTEYAPGHFKAVILQNARLLGRLASLGIIHAAPIPLFHNRIQLQRRDDHGFYQWHRGGRLDRWLSSCAFPNLGPTGLRDFEHFTTSTGSNRILYRYVGNHLLSLLLVTGSYFRNRDPSKIGMDINGRPVDARDLFNPRLFKEILQGIFTTYYEGFTGRAYGEPYPFDPNRLVERMIEEMGIDRHMEEILRVADQKAMAPETFRQLLLEWGYGHDQVQRMQPGREDIVIRSGPHLGAFNGTISLPELIAAIGSMAALCMLGRFLNERRICQKQTTCG